MSASIYEIEKAIQSEIEEYRDDIDLINKLKEMIREFVRNR